MTATDAHRSFLDAVANQLSRRPGATIAMAAEHEARVRTTVSRLLEAASAGVGSAAFFTAATTLHADEALLSSVFQNLDLFDIEDATGRGVALLVGEALSLPDP
ncbi:MAG: hypothetical protein ACYC2G_10435 [Gemmatimonadaceae bacterium]